MEHVMALAALLVPLVIALVAGLKQMGLPAKLGFPASLLVGLAASWLVASSGQVNDLTTGKPGLVSLVGILSALSASGLYSGLKNAGELLTPPDE